MGKYKIGDKVQTPLGVGVVFEEEVLKLKNKEKENE